MGKNCEGRLKGHHVTPGRGWRWQNFGGTLMLVDDGGGADVVLSSRAKGALMTCGHDGVMRPIIADGPLAVLLAAVPVLVDTLRDLSERDDRPRQLPLIRAALEKAGIA